MMDYGFTETNLEPDASGSSWSMKYTLRSDRGEFLDMCILALTTNPKRARLITAEQASNIRKQWEPAKSLKLRVGVSR